MKALKNFARRQWPSLYIFVVDHYYIIRAKFANRGPRRRFELHRGVGILIRQVTRLRGILYFLLLPVSLVRFLPAFLPPRDRRAADGSPEIVMLVISQVWCDPRVERAARTLAAAGYRVKIVYPDFFSPPDAPMTIDWGEGISFRPLPGHYYTYIDRFPYLLGVRYLRAVLQEQPFAFHAHDLHTALIGLAAAWMRRAHCVCDFHEWFSENVSWDVKRNAWGPHPPLRRWIYRFAERVVLARASAVITVCDSIAKEISAELSGGRRKVGVIRNIPLVTDRSERPNPPMREQVQIADDHFLLLWQGGTGPSRMIEPIIEALAFSPKTTFVIRGPSLDLFGPGYRDLAERMGVGDRLILLPPVKSSDVVAAARGADAGIWTLPNLSRNFYYALPNKIFEYMASGLPVLAAHYPEARRLVEGNGIGLCFDPYDPRSIAAQIERLAADPSLRDAMRARLGSVLSGLDTGREWQKLARLYDGLSESSRT